MYESFFGFVKRPFLAASTLDRYFPAACIEQTFQTTSRAIQRAEGPVAIFGGTGLGKTMCCLRIAESFRRNFEVVMLSSSQLITRRALLQSLLFELRMPYRDMEEGDLRLTLMSRLQPSSENPTDGLLLVVDEAQTLSMKLLDEIRLLTNVVRNGIPRVRLVLCGTMRLEDCLSHPQMDSLNQRLAARCYLTPLSNQETSKYVNHKIELSGVNGSSVMTRDALDAIYRGSDGIPRLIDQLADQSLLLACNERECPVSAAMIGRAWCMLQQLPNPWSEPESISKSSSTTNASITISNDATTSTFQTMEMNSIASQPHDVPSPSNIEFGELEDDYRDEMPFDSRVQITAPVASLTPLNAEVDLEDSVFETKPAPKVNKNLLDVFAGDFDEEFSIPVQSSGSYQVYSGASYGNLNHDLSNFNVSHQNSIDESALLFEEANDFLATPATGRSNILSDAFELGRVADTVSNISPEQAAKLERQIEEEMRELVSDLNSNAMFFDPAERTQPYTDEVTPIAKRNQLDDHRLAHQAHTDVISFSSMQYDSQGMNAEGAAMSDDRDLLIIEEDLEAVRSGVGQASSGANRAVLHPYAKLFTKLRSS